MPQQTKCRGCGGQLKCSVTWTYFNKTQSWHLACYRCGTIVRRLSKDRKYDKEKCLTKFNNYAILKKPYDRRICDDL